MANRYDNGSVSNFNPLSLQEVMMVPLMQRQKHDQLIAQQEMLRQGLAKVDPLDVHMNEALNVKSGIENKLASQAELLSREGINPNTQGDFLALNREYQNLISPTGRLGQINAAKQIYNANLKEFLDTAEKQGIGSNRALQLWQERNLNKYTGYDNNKNIATIGKLGVAAKQDYESDLSKYHSILGKTTTSAVNSGYRIVDSGQGDGSKVMIDSSGNVRYDSNIEQLNNAIKGFSQKWLIPQGEGYQYAKDAGLNITPQKVQNDFNAMIETSKIDNRGENAQYIAPKESKDGDSSTGSKLIENNTLFSPNALTSSPYSDNSKTLKDLQNRRSSLNSEERGKLAELETFQKKVNEDLKNNPEFNSTNNQLNSFLNKFSQNTKTILKDPALRQSFEPVQASTKGIFNAKGPDGKLIKGGDGKILQFTDSQIKGIYDNRQKLFEYENKLNKITNDVTKNNSITEYGYQLVPQTAKDETSIKLATETLENALKSGPKSLLNYANIESVDINGISRTGLDVEDKEKIQEVFNNSERGSFKIISFIPKTAKGKPGYIIEFNTKEGNSSNLNRYFRSESGSGEIGNGKPVRIKINYDQSKGKVLNTANGYIQEYLADKGDIDPRTGRKQGYDLAMDMRANADKSQINNEISKSNIKWNSMITPTTDFEKLNPFIQKQLQKELIKNYGLNNDTSDEELENMIKSFVKKEGNNNIYIE